MWVKWEDIAIDIIFDLDLKEKRDSNGYSCSLCFPESCVSYPDRYDLFVKHSFEPFLEWCNGTLSTSNWLAAFNYKDHWSEAKLSKTNSDPKLTEYTFVPLHLSKENKKQKGRTFVIADIHGCNRTFQQLLFNILKLQKDDTLILLGDYIDRGSDSKGVIDTILNLKRDGYNVIPILGNHEDFLLKAINAISFEDIEDWLENGGYETLQSYNVDIASDITPEHIEFMLKLPNLHITDTHVFVHAGLNFTLENPLIETDQEFMLWDRTTLDVDTEKIGGRKMISGHTIRDIDDIVESLETDFIQLDNGCFLGSVSQRSGNLLALELKSGELFVQVNIEL